MKNGMFAKISEALKDEAFRRSVLGKLVYAVVLFSAMILLYNVLFKEVVRDNIIVDDDGGTEILREADRLPDVYDEVAIQEERLQEILSQIKGVGEVDVMLTYEVGTETTATFSTREISQVKGVIVVAQGASSAAIKSDIMKAVGAVFNIPVSRITVFEKN
jgi:stage III sporulation protein AG